MDVPDALADEVGEDEGAPVCGQEASSDGGGGVAQNRTQLVHEILVRRNVFEPRINGIFEEELTDFLPGREKGQEWRGSMGRGKVGRRRGHRRGMGKEGEIVKRKGGNRMDRRVIERSKRRRME